MGRLIILAILCLLSGFVCADWQRPAAVTTNLTSQNATNYLAYAIDTSLTTGWAENSSTGQVEMNDYDYGATFDLGGTYNVTGIKLYTNGWLTYADPSKRGTICSVGIIKVCNDVNCVGENNIWGGGNCIGTRDTGFAYDDCNFTSTTGRYLHIEGGVGNNNYDTCLSKSSLTELGQYVGGGLSGLGGIFDIQANVYPLPVDNVTFSTSLCQAQCDYLLQKSVPIPLSGIPGLPAIWNITLGDSSYTNLEGQKYLNNDLNNTVIVAYNSTGTGSCTGNVWGNILEVKRYTGVNPNRILINYTYGVADAGCTYTPPYITICFNGTNNLGNNYPATATDYGTDSAVYDLKSDSQAFYHYNINYFDENNGRKYNFTSSGDYATFYCKDNYDLFTINLNLVNTSYIVQTRSPINIKTNIVPTGNSRYYETSAGGLYNIYLPNATKNNTNYQWRLVDYTGGEFYKGKLEIYMNVNDSIIPIHIQSFQTDNLITTYLQPNNQYKIVLTGSKSTRDLGPIYLVSDDTVKDVVVSTPTFNDYVHSWDIVQIQLTSNYDLVQVSCAVNSSVTNTATFEVWNTTTNPYVMTYNATTSGYTLAMTYTVPNVNDTYFLRCTSVNQYGSYSKERIVFFHNESALYKGFDLNIPSTFLGLDRTFLYNILALVLIFLIGNLFSQVTIGYGSILMTLTAMLLKWMGWFTAMGWTILLTLLALSIAIKMAERRIPSIT